MATEYRCPVWSCRDRERSGGRGRGPRERTATGHRQRRSIRKRKRKLQNSWRRCVVVAFCSQCHGRVTADYDQRRAHNNGTAAVNGEQTGAATRTAAAASTPYGYSSRENKRQSVYRVGRREDTQHTARATRTETSTTDGGSTTFERFDFRRTAVVLQSDFALYHGTADNRNNEQSAIECNREKKNHNVLKYYYAHNNTP